MIAGYFDNKDLSVLNPIQFLAHANAVATFSGELKADSIVRELCHAYRTSSKAEKLNFTSNHAGDRSLLTFAHRMANCAMRNGDGVSCVLDAITAIAIENCAFDSRESVVCCAMLRHATDTLGLDFASIASNLTDTGNSDATEIISHFASLPANSIKLGDYALCTNFVSGFEQIEWQIMGSI